MATRRRRSASSDVLDQLFRAPPDAFVEERNALARALDDAGHADDARALKRMKKPTVAIWALNQAVRSNPKDAQALQKAAESLRGAQRGALKERGRAALEKSAEAMRRHESTLLRRTRAAARRAEKSLSSSQLDQVRDTLRAMATAAPQDVEAFANGRLTEPLQPAGMDVVLGLMKGGTGRRRPRQKAASRPSAAERRKRQGAHQRATKALKWVRIQARKANRDAVQRERAAARAQKLAERAREKANAVDEKLKAAEAEASRTRERRRTA